MNKDAIFMTQKLRQKNTRSTRVKSFYSTASTVLLCLGFILLALTIFVPDIFTNIDPLTTNTANTFAKPNVQHWLGTDQTGRDVYARVIHGARVAVLTGLIATLVAATAGALVGTLAAFAGNKVRTLILRVTEACMAVPEFLLALLIVAYTGTGAVGVTIAVALAQIAGYTKISLLSAHTAVKDQAHISARILGINPWRRFSVYVLPNALRPVLSVATIGVGLSILTITGLTFLGLGLTPPDPDWGAMLSQGKTYLTRGWWAVVAPGVALVCTVLLFTIAGRRLQKRWLGAA